MCGILFHLSRKQPLKDPCSALLGLLSRRGPDSCATVTFERDGAHLRFTSTVLSLRGKELTKQPLVDGDGRSVLCWNGEAWRVNGRTLHPDVNDAILVQKSFLRALSADNSDEAILGVLRSVEGPYAFVLYDGIRGHVWFGRDVLGRRSLLLSEKDGEMVIASVGDSGREKGWKEVEADGVYVLELQSGVTKHIPYVDAASTPFDCLSLVNPFPRLNPEKPIKPVESPTTDSPSVTELQRLLQESVRLRVQDVPTVTHSQRNDSPFHREVSEARVAVLFSGGLDCTVLARLAHEVLPKDETIDLLNVAFENRRVVAAQSGTQRKNTKSSLAQEVISVADFDPYALCPDRETGVRSYEELRRACPERHFRFVKINVPYEEVLEHKLTVQTLLYPHNTQMDLSIGLAFYFSARGSGILHPVNEAYTTTSRVLLSGLGADELFGGYQRHSTAFRRGGFATLIEELQLDVSRLGKRNLGRDDRILSHWSKETRFPFLDENVVRYALSLPVWEKCAFGVEGTGEDEAGKAILRMVARRLGMDGVSAEKKRAIQFGARSAKMEVGAGRVKGTDALN